MPRAGNATRRSVRFAGVTSATRTDSFMGVEYLVVPTVILMETVLWAVNAETPEYVPAKALAFAPEGWDGRPVVAGHPIREGVEISANVPDVLEENQLGVMFGTLFKKNKLQTEAWIEIARTTSLSRASKSIMRRLERDEPIEVSVGAFVLVNEVEGEFDGMPYKGEWEWIVPDHLAFLDTDEIGACSIDMGCGSGRTAHLHTLSGDSLTISSNSERSFVISMPETPAKKSSWLSVLREAHRASKELKTPPLRIGAATFDMSDSDVQLRRDLEIELRAKVPGFMYVEGISLSDKIVLFSAMPRDDWKFFTHEYSDRGGTIKLKGDAKEVEAVTRFEPVNEEVTTAAAAAPSVAASIAPTTTTASAPPCGCPTQEVPIVKTIQERVNALIANSHGKLTTEDASWLAAVPEPRMAALEAAMGFASTPSPGTPPAPQPQEAPAPPSQAPTQPSAPSTPPAQPSAPTHPTTASATPQDVQAYLATLPPSVRTVMEESLRVSSSRRAALTTQIKASGRNQFSDEQLAAKLVDELEMMVMLLGGSVPPVVDYSGRAPVVAAAAAADIVPPPPDVYAGIRAAAGKSTH